MRTVPHVYARKYVHVGEQTLTPKPFAVPLHRRSAKDAKILFFMQLQDCATMFFSRCIVHAKLGKRRIATTLPMFAFVAQVSRKARNSHDVV